jgi:hypothetical protein
MIEQMGQNKWVSNFSYNTYKEKDIFKNINSALGCKLY